MKLLCLFAVLFLVKPWSLSIPR